MCLLQYKFFFAGEKATVSPITVYFLMKLEQMHMWNNVRVSIVSIAELHSLQDRTNNKILINHDFIF
jgi:hypothetical protein